VEWSIESKTPTAARDTLTHSRLKEVCPILFHTLTGWLSSVEKDSENAKAEFLQAVDALNETTRRDHILLLAQGLSVEAEDALAIPLFERCYNPGVFNDECKKLLDCARRLERHDVSARIYRELREAGTSDPRVIETEIRTLQLYDPKEALRVASEYLHDHPQNRHVALWQSTLALRLDSPELVIDDLSRLPGVGDLTPEGCGLVINILDKVGKHADALSYAYDALRAHFDNEFAHGQFMCWFLRLHKLCPELQSDGKAAPGSAICYREDRDETDRWVIIEDGPNPELTRYEFPPDHPVSKAFIGHSPEEVVVLADSGIQSRPVTLRHTLHKFTYRYQVCCHQYQILFPHGTAIQLLHVGSEDEFDPSHMVKNLEGRKEHIEKLDEMYRCQLMPLITYAALAGRDEIEVWSHLSSKPDLGIRCASGNDRELRGAIELAKTCKVFVVDFTALITLARLDLLRLLQIGPGKCVVSQTVYEHIQHLVERAEQAKDSDGSFVFSDGGKLTLAEVPPEHRRHDVNFITGIGDAVGEYCEVRPCRQAAELEPNRREILVKTIGRHCLDSILLATAPDTALWTDDLVVGQLGQTEFEAQRIWTQAVLFVSQQAGIIKQHEFNQAVAKLVGWHYLGITLNEETFVAAAEIAEWKMDNWPMPAIIRTLGIEVADTATRIATAAKAIRTVWRIQTSFAVRQEFLFAVLSGLSSTRLVNQLQREIPQVFFVDVVSAAEVQNLIGFWLRNHPGLMLP
jgi:hypothetical protein